MSSLAKDGDSHTEAYSKFKWLDAKDYTRKEPVLFEGVDPGDIV